MAQDGGTNEDTLKVEQLLNDIEKETAKENGDQNSKEKLKEGKTGKKEDEDDEEEDEDEDEEEDEEYLAQVEALKSQGNEAFKNKEYATAIEFYSQAISIDPDNHLLYSNRSAAYLAEGNSKSKALKDAEKCVELAPDFVKGYSRLGAAQHSLKRYQAAYDTYRSGLEIEKNNAGLLAALQVTREALEQDRRDRWRVADAERTYKRERGEAESEAKSAERRAKEIEDRHKAEEKEENSSNGDDALLGAFFSELTGAKQKKPEKKTKKVVVAQEKYLKQDLGTAGAQVERLLQPNWKFKNLNPFFVLDLDIDANEEDFKQRYRKLATLVHPDKNLDIEDARQAFEEVKTAYQSLMDEKKRKTAILTIETAIKATLRERARLLNKGATVEQVGDEDEHIQKETMKAFAEIEMRRRQTEKLKQAHKAREQGHEDEEKRQEKKLQEFNKDWAKEDRRDKRVGNWREYEKDSKRSKVSKAARTKMWKEETRAEEKPKFGQVKLEEWKKNWK